MLGELRDAVKSGDYMAVKLALNSKEEYNLDQEVCSRHSVLYKTRPTQFHFYLMFWMNLVFIYFFFFSFIWVLRFPKPLNQMHIFPNVTDRTLVVPFVYVWGCSTVKNAFKGHNNTALSQRVIICLHFWKYLKTFGKYKTVVLHFCTLNLTSK